MLSFRFGIGEDLLPLPEQDYRELVGAELRVQFLGQVDGMTLV